MSLIRLDRIEVPLYDLRVYTEPGDPTRPLAEEMRKPAAVGRVEIGGQLATVTTALGNLSSPQAWIDFDAAMAANGVNLVLWERHKNGRILMKKRRIKL